MSRGVYLLPSLFTLGNMFCGYACIVFAMQGQYETAAPFIGFAIVLVASRDAAQTVGRRLEWNFQERTPRRSNLSVGVAAWDGCKSGDGLLDEARRALTAQRQTATVAQMA